MKEFIGTYKYFFIVWFVGLCAALVIGLNRMETEAGNHSVALTYDYGHLTELAPTEGKTIDEALEMFRTSGVTSFAVYDETPGTLMDDGYIKVYRDIDQIKEMGISTLKNEDSSIFIVKGHRTNSEIYFTEMYDDLLIRLPAGYVSLVESISDSDIIVVRGVEYDAFMKMELGISAARINEVASHGFGVVVRPTNYASMNKAVANHFLNRVTQSDAVHAVMFVGQTAIGYPNEHLYIAEKLKEHKIPIVLLEAPNQLRFENQIGAVPMLEHMDYYGVRAYSMYRDELVKLGTEEASQRYFISDIERNIRLSHFSTYKRPIPGKTLLESDAEYIHLTAEKLKARGFELSKPGIMKEFFPSRILLLLALASVMSIFSLSIHALTGISTKFSAFIGAFTYIVFAGMIFFDISAILARQVGALMAAVFVPVVTMYALMKWWKSLSVSTITSMSSIIFPGVIGIILATFFSLAGGWLLGGILTDTRFMLELEIFRGVKLSFVLPVFFTVILYLRIFPTFLTSPLVNMNDWEKFSYKIINTPVRFGSLLLLAFLGLAGLIFVGRSGHSGVVPVSGLEVHIRRGLEALLYARPRVKEFLIGQPAFMMLPFIISRKWPQWLHFLTVIAVGIAQASVVETFAHMRSPLWMSTVRGLNGMFFGGIIGMACVFICYFLTIYINSRRENNAAK